MLSIDRPDQPPSPSALQSRGGFAWWYVDLLDADHNGIVLIWSWGMPFLPGYASQARAGRAPRAIERPSLNVAVYRRGVPAFYLLQEYARPQATWDEDGTWQLGDSRILRSMAGGEVSLDVHLSCAIAGTRERLTGTVHLEGPARQPSRTSTAGDHTWTPLLGPSVGTAELSLCGEPMAVRGWAYHDRNASTRPLHDLGIGTWTWGRTVDADAVRIWYLLWPEDGREPQVEALEIDRTGHTTHLDGVTAQLSGRRSGWLGVPRWNRLDLRHRGSRWLSVRAVATVDDGPFYVRQIARVTGPNGADLPGFTEVVVPDRVDRAVYRPLVRMAVDGPSPSRWLPLFSGPSTSRLRRLARAWRGR